VRKSPRRTKSQPRVRSARQIDALDELLLDRPDDEKGGPDGTLGFSFQQWWATLKIVEMLAQTDDDFAVGMEIKEDVTILNSASSPTEIEFCQIKKNEKAGSWTFKELHRAAKPSKVPASTTSILAKLYSRRYQFRAHDTKLRFVSNVGYKIPVPPDGQSANSHGCALILLHKESVQDLQEQIAKQLGIKIDEIQLDNFVLERTDLPLQRQHLLVSGLLSENCNSARIPFSLPQPGVAARVLASEVQERASNTNYALSLKELQSRIISRQNALQVLASVSAASKEPLQETLDKAIARLNHERYRFLAVRQIENQRVAVCAGAVDRTNTMFWTIANALRMARPFIVTDAKSSDLGGLLESLMHTAQLPPMGDFNAMAGYAEAIALLVIYEAIHVDSLVPTFDTQPQEKQ
jgi:hypothetical protein